MLFRKGQIRLIANTIINFLPFLTFLYYEKNRYDTYSENKHYYYYYMSQKSPILPDHRGPILKFEYLKGSF